MEGIMPDEQANTASSRISPEGERGAGAPEENVGSADLSRDDREAILRFVHETLRENLHLAVNQVLSAHFRDQRVREALAAELLGTIDAVVDDYVTAAELGEAMPDAMRPASSAGQGSSPQTVDEAMAALRGKMQAALGGDRPGIRRGATAAVKLSPMVVKSLTTFVHDDVALGRAQRGAEILLSRYLHPLIARNVVSFAAAAARRAARGGRGGEA
jgi:hypothetical protein